MARHRARQTRIEQTRDRLTLVLRWTLQAHRLASLLHDHLPWLVDHWPC